MSRVTPCFRLMLASILAVGLLGSAGTRAEDDFLAALTQAQSLYRSATASLRAGKAEDVAPAFERLAEAWTRALAAARSRPPAVAIRIPLFPELLQAEDARLKRAGEAAVRGRAEAALEELQPLKREWITIRRAAGLYGLVECLDEASGALRAFLGLRGTPQDLARPETRGEVIARAAVYRYALRRCDAFAALDEGIDADYRRQADAIAAALDVVDSALRLRDGALLERVLGDLETFDTQLSQRYGG